MRWSVLENGIVHCQEETRTRSPLAPRHRRPSCPPPQSTAATGLSQQLAGLSCHGLGSEVSVQAEVRHHASSLGSQQQQGPEVHKSSSAACSINVH